MDIYKTLSQIQEVKNTNKRRHKKRRNQTKRDFILKQSKHTCAYCNKPKNKRELSIIRKDHDLKSGQIFENQNNRIVACKKCASKKGSLNHDEFKKLLAEEKKQKRDEILENYTTFAARVFERYDYKCIYCEFEYGTTPDNVKLTIDHKNPLGQQGENKERNLACSCEYHNIDKGNHTAEEYFKYLERNGRKHTLLLPIEKTKK